jgi:cell division protein FtsW
MLRSGVGANEVRDNARKRSKILRVDKGLAVVFLLLLASGLVILYAASFYNAQDTGSSLSEVYSQLLGIAVGFAGMAVILQIDYRILADGRICISLLGISFVLLILVAIPGIGKMLNGSRRWLRFGPVSFQPSELAKYASILYLARALSMRSRDVTKFLRGLVPMFIIPGCMFLLILLQPNLSTAGSIIIAAAVMVMMAGARWLHLGLVGAAGLALGTFYALSEDYRRARLMSFRNPFDYLTNEGYQLSQSLLAFGSGGLFGMGLGMGRQKYAFLPYPESDFIFAVVGEDLGFIGCCSVLALFGAFIFFGLRIAIRCQDRFGSLLVVGITTLIAMQTFLNIGVVTGLLPTTGISLPFFSYGGTALCIQLAEMGIVLSVSRQMKPPKAG